MRKISIYIALILSIFAVYSCSTNDNISYNEEPFEISEIVFPSNPIEIANNEELDKILINYFCIVKVDNEKYYMYYQAFDKDVPNMNDWYQNVYFAYSRDGFNWTHSSPYGKGDNLIMKGLVEMSVFLG